MLPEFILKEERLDNFALLILLGSASALLGYAAAKFLWPGKSSLLTVIFASLPLVYPLTTKFLEDEKEEINLFLDEIKIYLMLFIGQATGFMILSILNPNSFAIQAEIAGISGKATSNSFFLSILSNNMRVFTAIFAISTTIGSAGSFILVWNASVLGKFFSSLISNLEGIEVLTGTAGNPSPLAYVPHAAFEMTGFIIAGISGSLISAALYRKHFDRETWKGITKLLVSGVLCIIVGALLETA